MDAELDAEQNRKGIGVDYWAKCITIYLPNSKAKAFHRRTVLVTGKVTVIEQDDLRSLWTCNPVALEMATIRPG